MYPSLSDPPRRVPLLVRLKLRTGGFVNQFGWAFFGFGMIFYWIFATSCDLAAWWDFRKPLELTQGVITRCEDTGAKENERRVFRHEYSYQVGGAPLTGISYAVGRRSEPGDEVGVEFVRERPERSRILAMRTAMFPPLVLLVLIFPVFGFAFILAGSMQAKRAIRLLRNGKQGQGRFIGQEATNTRVNNRTVYKMKFEFEADDGAAYQAVARTHETERLRDEVTEPLLYDPHDPEDAVLLDALPGQPRIDEEGEIHVGSATKTMLCLILPTVSIVGHGAVTILRLLG